MWLILYASSPEHNSRAATLTACCDTNLLYKYLLSLLTGAHTVIVRSYITILQKERNGFITDYILSVLGTSSREHNISYSTQDEFHTTHFLGDSAMYYYACPHSMKCGRAVHCRKNFNRLLSSIEESVRLHWSFNCQY